MAKDNPKVVWFRRTDGLEICASEGSAAAEHMRRENFEEIDDPTGPASPLAPTSVASASPPGGVPAKATRQGAKPKSPAKKK